MADTANDKIYEYLLPRLDYFPDPIAEGSTTNSIVDIQVDHFEYIWALDSSSRITKYDWDLTPLCYYYEPDQFETTSGFLIALGVGGSADMYICETWSPSSGIQHYAIGTDILDLQVTSDEMESLHEINYTAVDVSIIEAEIYEHNNFGAKVKTLADSDWRYAGHTAHVWDGTNDAGQQMPTGDYSYRIRSTSLYFDAQTGVPVNRVIKTGSFQHVRPCCIGIRGNVDGSADETANIADLLYLTVTLFQGGPQPPCFEEADVEASGVLNVADLTYLTAYLFGGGPAPLVCP